MGLGKAHALPAVPGAGMNFTPAVQWEGGGAALQPLLPLLLKAAAAAAATAQAALRARPRHPARHKMC